MFNLFKKSKNEVVETEVERIVSTTCEKFYNFLANVVKSNLQLPDYCNFTENFDWDSFYESYLSGDGDKHYIKLLKQYPDMCIKLSVTPDDNGYHVLTCIDFIHVSLFVPADAIDFLEK